MITHITEAEQNRITTLQRTTEALTMATKERDELKENLIFIERWAVHHTLLPSVTSEQALSCIAHYPPIRAIAEAYSGGVFRRYQTRTQSVMRSRLRPTSTGGSSKTPGGIAMMLMICATTGQSWLSMWHTGQTCRAKRCAIWPLKTQ